MRTARALSFALRLSKKLVVDNQLHNTSLIYLPVSGQLGQRRPLVYLHGGGGARTAVPFPAKGFSLSLQLACVSWLLVNIFVIKLSAVGEFVRLI